MEETIIANKPEDWPQNQREARLSNVLYAVEDFQENPNYATKEVLLSLISEIDPNQHDDLGLMRISDYEVALINQLYLYATTMCLGSLKIFLYKQITETTRFFNMFSKFPWPSQNANDIEKYSYLFLPLKLFYLAYRNFNYYKERSFCDELLATVNDCETLVKQGNISLDDIEYAFTNLMYELSNASGINTIPFIEFNRKELLKLFEKEFDLLEKLHKDPMKRPLKGVLKMAISNWILRARNNYNHSSVFKCLSNKASKISVENKEIWMHKVELLNDKREGKVIKELFSNKKWIKTDWAKNVKLNNPYTFYVTSFSKEYPTEMLKHKYGKNVYGYRSDKISNIVSPIMSIHGFPQFGQSLSFDIIYDRNEAKDELNFLFDIIDRMHINSKEKTSFANEIISYWFLSFKDKKWKEEKERRYQIFYYNQYKYFDVDLSDEFLKIKSSVYLFPDNISKDNNYYDLIRANIFDRYFATATKEFIQCNDCLNIDFEVFGLENDYVCPICGSNDCKKIDPKELRKKHPN